MRYSGIVLIGILVACNVGGPSLVLVATTDRATYERSPTDATVYVTIENRGVRAAALSGCPTPPYTVIERRFGGGWEEGGTIGITCLAIYMTETVRLDGGGRFEFAVNVFTTGQHRLRVLVGVDASYPDAVVYSNTFIVE